MRITLIIGPTERAATRFRNILKNKSALLEKHGVHSPDWNHIRLYMACSDTDQVGVVRFKRGFEFLKAQQGLYKEIGLQLDRKMAESNPDHIVLATGQLGSMLSRRSELERLRTLLSPFSDDIRIAIHLAEPSRALAVHYANRVLEGRRASLDVELSLARGDGSWWDGALNLHEPSDPLVGLFNDIQHPPFWLDYARLVQEWGAVFGPDKIILRPEGLDHLYSAQGADEINMLLGTDLPLGTLEPETPEVPPAAAHLARARQFNAVLIPYMKARGLSAPRNIWRNMLSEIAVPGEMIDPGSLFEVSNFFAQDIDARVHQHPQLKEELTNTADPATAWAEADPHFGFRASQYLTAWDFRLRRNSQTIEELRAERKAGKTELSETALAIMPSLAVQNFEKLRTSSFAPHNRIGAVNEDMQTPPYTAMPPRELPKGSTGNVIVGCMKNEAPYILEWVAYHRAMGVDNFLIYTNGCEDGTSELLDHLQTMGILQHRLNDDWRGNSPQQHALNRSLKEPLIRNADWIIHIDVDEFMNVRCGNGTLQDVFDRVPDATNIAMTWRLFGHNGVTDLSDDFVIDQFDTCAPKFCPKPHTVWGFKTMFKNIGAYEKISCHRPNKLVEARAGDVKWVNGSGRDMTNDAAKKGWRNSKKNIGYDLIQLNHYALRSAESFLIKRQRGRALHVDRSIGINYWIRMDWSDFLDITIKRNSPRVRAEYDRLMQDETLRRLHEDGCAWHRAKADELHKTPEFRDLYEQALKVKLNETERVAYALALDMES